MRAQDDLAASRLTAEVRANSSTIAYEYEYETTTSRLKKRTDSLGQETNYEYFLDDQLKEVTYTNATVSTPTVSMTYDANYGRPATMTDGIGTTTYSYKAAGTLGALKVASINGPLSDDTITYTYDALGRVATRTLGSVTTTWNLDALGWLESLVDPLGTFGFSYDGHTSRLAELSYPNGQTSTYSYVGNSVAAASGKPSSSGNPSARPYVLHDKTLGHILLIWPPAPRNRPNPRKRRKRPARPTAPMTAGASSAS